MLQIGDYFYNPSTYAYIEVRQNNCEIDVNTQTPRSNYARKTFVYESEAEAFAEHKRICEYLAAYGEPKYVVPFGSDSINRRF